MNVPRSEWFAPLAMSILIVVSGLTQAESANPAVTKLLAEYEKEVGDKVTESHDKDITNIRAKYTVELKQNFTRATKSGNLEDSVAMQKEIDLLESGAGIPDSDKDATLALQKMRANFRTAYQKAADARNTKLQPIFTRYDRSLADIQASLTKSGKLDEATAVKTERELLLSKAGAAGEGKSQPQGRINKSRVRVDKNAPIPAADGWMLLYEAGQLHGCAPDLELIRNERIAVQDGALLLDNTSLPFLMRARSVEIRVVVKKVSGQNLSLGCRGPDGYFYTTWFNGGNNIGVGKLVDGKYSDIRATTEGPKYDGFFTLGMKVEGKSILVRAEDRTVFDFQDGDVTDGGKIVVSAKGGVALFRKIEARVIN